MEDCYTVKSYVPKEGWVPLFVPETAPTRNSKPGNHDTENHIDILTFEKVLVSHEQKQTCLCCGGQLIEVHALRGNKFDKTPYIKKELNVSSALTTDNF